MKNILGKSLVLLLTSVTIFFLTPSSLMAGKPTKNITPIAVAGIDQNEYVGELVTLDGSGSYDPDDGPEALTYLWQIKKAPRGSTATLSDTTVVSPTFTPDIVGTYQMNLIVNDGIKKSRTDSMIVTVIEGSPNTPPVADAGADQDVDIGDTVTLDGSGSIDVDGDDLSYQWIFVSKPDGSNATLSNSTSVSPTFITDLTGSYVVQLTVNDGTVDSEADTITVDANNVVTHVSNTMEFRQALIDAAQNGLDDKIILADGIYKTTDDGEGTFRYLDNEAKNLTLVGSGYQNAILSGAHQNQILNLISTSTTANFKIEKITLIDGNTSETGGALYTVNNIEILDCNISNNTALAGGGFAFKTPSTTSSTHFVTKVTNSIFTNNIATGDGNGYGGGFWFNSYKMSTYVTNSTFTNNISYGYGGGFSSSSSASLSSTYSQTIVLNSTFSDNIAQHGGGFRSATSKTKVDNSTFSNNTASLRGAPPVSSSEGGAFTGVNSEVKDSVFTNNHADRSGGGIYSSSSLLASNCILRKNTASERGGGISSANIQLSNLIFVDHENAIYTLAANNFILNSIFYNTDISNITGGSTTIVTLKNNYIDLGKVEVPYFDINNIFADINLGFVDKDNYNYHLTADSDLIDAGLTTDPDVDIPTTDLDGNPRPVGASTDIGPYEYQ